MRTIEIYIGYEDKSWDTDYIEIPDTLVACYSAGSDITDELAKIYDKHLKSIEPKILEGLPEISFIGIYNFPSKDE